MTTTSSQETEISISAGLHNLAIAQVVLFSIIHLVQVPLRYMQEWRYWHHNKRRHPARCVLYSWWSMVGLLAMIRIVGSAMVLSNSRPGESMMTAEISLQSVGLSPLFFEVSLVLLRCGQAGYFGPGNSRYPKALRIALHGFRFPIFVSIVLGVVGRIIEMKALGEAGSVLLVVTFIFVCGLVVWLAFKSYTILPVEGHRGVLLEFGPSKFNPASGDVGILAGMGLVMEVIIVSLLLSARAAAEPIWNVQSKSHVVTDDVESS